MVTPAKSVTVAYTLTCSCGWRHTAYGRDSATNWKRYHRQQNTPKGSRLSESGHDVVITKGGAQ